MNFILILNSLIMFYYSDENVIFLIFSWLLLNNRKVIIGITKMFNLLLAKVKFPFMIKDSQEIIAQLEMWK